MSAAMRSPFDPPEPARSPSLDVAAVMAAYLVTSAGATYSEATAALFRSAIRSGLLADDMSIEAFQDMTDAAEVTLNLTIMDLGAESEEKIRRTLRRQACVEFSPRLAGEVAHVVNAMCGAALPDACVDRIVREETSHG